MTLPLVGMPMLREYTERLGPTHFHGTNVVYVNHLISDSLMTARALKRCGARLWCVGIPYGDLGARSQREILDGLCEIGWVDAPFVDRPTRFAERMHHAVDRALAAAARDARASGRALMIVEDGGYAFPRLDVHPDRAVLEECLIGAVEHTTRGMLNYRYRELDGEPATLREVHHPAITIADSSLKTAHEARFVAEALMDELGYLLRRNHEFINDRAVVLIGGAGRIGRGLVRCLESKTTRLTIVDPNAGGLDATNATCAESVTTEMLQEAFLVFGVTGRASVPLTTFRAWLDQALDAADDIRLYFASASSKSLEFENLITWLDEQAVGEEQGSRLGVTRQRIRDHGTRYVVADRHRSTGSAVKVTFLADGYPVIFFPAHSHGAANLAMDPVMSQLFLSAALVQEAHATLPNGVHSLAELGGFPLPPGPWTDLLDPEKMLSTWERLAGTAPRRRLEAVV